MCGYSGVNTQSDHTYTLTNGCVEFGGGGANEYTHTHTHVGAGPTVGFVRGYASLAVRRRRTPCPRWIDTVAVAVLPAAPVAVTVVAVAAAGAGEAEKSTLRDISPKWLAAVNRKLRPTAATRRRPTPKPPPPPPPPLTFSVAINRRRGVPA